MSDIHRALSVFPMALASLVLCTTGAFAQVRERDFTGIVGVGVSSGPEFSGSDETSTQAFPIIDLVWRDRFFLNQRGLGVFALRNRGSGDLSLGFAIGYDFDERLVEDDERLRGLRDVEAGGLVTAFLEYDAGIADLEFELSQGISSDGHEGTRATFGAEFSAPLGDRLQVSAKPFIVWSDGSYADAFYGVTVAEAASSRFAAFDAGSGFERVGLELTASYSLTERTGVFLGIEHSRLLGDAKDSPISFDDGQTEISTGVFFRF